MLVNFTLEVFLSSRLWNPAWRWNFTQFWRIKPQHPLSAAIHNLWSLHAKYSSVNKESSHSGKGWFAKCFEAYMYCHVLYINCNCILCFCCSCLFVYLLCDLGDLPWVQLSELHWGCCSDLEHWCWVGWNLPNRLLLQFSSNASQCK